MSAERQWRLCRATHDECHELSKQISTQVINNLLMNIRLAGLNHRHFKDGFDAFEGIKIIIAHPDQDSPPGRISTAEALIKTFQEDYKREMSIFTDQAHVNAQMKFMIDKFKHSKHVLVNGTDAMRSSVIYAWKAAVSQAEFVWGVYQYEYMEWHIENCYKETKKVLRDLASIEERQNQSGNYTGHDEEQLAAVRSKLQEIHKTGSRYLKNIKGPKERELGKANDRIRELMAEMTSLRNQIDDKRKVKMNANIKQLQQDKRSETHVKYEIYVKVDDAKFQADVCIRNGQQPLFCAAKTRPFEPPIGVRNTGSSNWTPPTLEVQLGTTSDPQSIILKELNASSSYIHGSFSKKDIIVKLPQKSNPFSKTTVETSGTFGPGPNTGKHTAKVTCTRKGTENCTGYACKEPSLTHWIDSGTNRS
ncbi:hypothetical protein ACEPAI_7428 [Sanghuangporus weigelae]